MSNSKENITSTKDSSKPPKSGSKTSKSPKRFQNTIAGSKFNTRFEFDMKSNNGDNKFKVEEFLVIYYVSIVIRLSKLSDGHKAITEYNKKKGLSKIALAHIYKILGVLTMLSEEKDFYKAKGYFERSVKYFEQVKPHKGHVISKLALLRCECEIEFKKISKTEDLKDLVCKTEELKFHFEQYKHDLGISRCDLYID